MVDLKQVKVILSAKGIVGHWDSFLGDSLDKRHIVALIVEIEKLRKVEQAARNISTARSASEIEDGVYALGKVMDEFDAIGQPLSELEQLRQLVGEIARMEILSCGGDEQAILDRLDAVVERLERADA